MDSSVLTEQTHADANEVIAAFAANHAFRSAQADELVNDENPFRRPVRPHDLPMLDYSRELGRDDFLSLSSLLGHRMLLNAYEAEYLSLPRSNDPGAVAGFGEFYSRENLALADRARPILERHLFSFLDAGDNDAGAATGDADVQRICAELELKLTDADEKLATTIDSLTDGHAAAIFTLLQLTCEWQARESALARGTLGDYAMTHPRFGEAVRQHAAEAARAALTLRPTLERAGLLIQPRAYWQFYLSSSLARTNNLYRLARDHSRFFEFLGALVHRQLCDRAFERALVPMFGELVGAPINDGVGADASAASDGAGAGHQASSAARLLDPLLEIFGPQDVLPPFLAGLRGAHELHALARDDLSRQITWADDLDRYKAEAARLQHLIDDGQLVVDLDTFVESSEETSTTHVHDEHRLVVIEHGSMTFWNNVDSRIGLSTGDMLLVPRTRLHGSVVLSGECTYHQPIVPEECVFAER